jgi:DNA polymerase-4
MGRGRDVKDLRRSEESSVSRVIVHLDLDAFFAAVEVLENPSLEGKPVIIGGRPGERGVVATASYAAREYGVRSAMPMAQALRLCPRAVVLPPRHRDYRDYSRRVMALVRALSPVMEQVSIDEAYVDLTDQVEVWDDAVELARQLQGQVRERVGLSASLGVATNKLVAKVASDRDKPGGLTVVPPGEEAAFLVPLPVRVLRGVGPVTAGKLSEMGIATVGDLARVPEQELRARFGKQGGALARQAQGIGSRRLVTERRAKSVSQERTFARDVSDAEALEETLERLSQRVASQLRKAGRAAGTVAIKVRYGDFTTLTRQMSMMEPADDGQIIYRAALVLFERAWEPGQAVRLLGVGGYNLCAPSKQLPLL